MAVFTAKVASLLDAGKALTTTLINQLWDNTTYAKDRLDTHVHNGTDGSAIIEVGPNLVRNGSFESGTPGWTTATYTGGTVAISTSALHGIKSLAFTSTVLANGGGNALGDEYIPVAPGRSYTASALFKASVANVSSQIEIIWYDSALAQLSISLSLVTDTPIIADLQFIAANAPASAAYARIRVYGGVPAQGTATGVIYVDDAGFGLTKGLLKFTNITASGTFTPQLSTTKIHVKCVGAGGDGGNGDGNQGGSGGKAGAVVHDVITSIAASYTTTIGAAPGGATSFGSITAAGGANGKDSVASTTAATGLDGDSCVGIGGTGGNTGGNAAANSGAGGGGSKNIAAKGLGGSGLIQVWEFAE